MTQLTTKDFWRKARGEYLISARACRQALTDHYGSYRYASDDERVKAAVTLWVGRARNAHAFAMGRKPVIEKMVVITNAGIQVGKVFAREAV